jgi:uncharacterized protein (TIGR02147 family)
MNIYAYDDFKQYLQDLFLQRKKDRQKYTHRTFAQEAGFTNPGYFNDVIKGKRRLSDAALEKIITVFDIQGVEADFLRLLTKFNQCKHSETKQELYNTILFRRSKSNFVRMNPAQGKYYQDFRYPLVRAAIEACDFRGNYERLSTFLNPPMPVAMLKKIVRDLCTWGLVSQTPSGAYRVTERFVEPTHTLKELIRNLNRVWIQHGADAIERFSPDERHISSILMSVNHSTAQKITHLTEKYRQEIFKLIQEDQEPDRLLQLNIQLFPRSAIKDGKK